MTAIFKSIAKFFGVKPNDWYPIIVNTESHWKHSSSGEEYPIYYEIQYSPSRNEIKMLCTDGLPYRSDVKKHPYYKHMYEVYSTAKMILVTKNQDEMLKYINDARKFLTQS